MNIQISQNKRQPPKRPPFATSYVFWLGEKKWRNKLPSNTCLSVRLEEPLHFNFKRHFTHFTIWIYNSTTTLGNNTRYTTRNERQYRDVRSTTTRPSLSSADATPTTTTLPSAPKCCFTGNATRGRACVTFSVRTIDSLRHIYTSR